jgi:hypothetical protein
MQQIQTMLRAIVASTVIIATELTIFWNKIEAVNSVATAGQIIPLFVGSFAVVRIFYLWCFSQEPDDPALGRPAINIALPLMALPP